MIITIKMFAQTQALVAYYSTMDNLIIMKLSSYATTPTRMNSSAARFDLYSAEKNHIEIERLFFDKN